MPLLLNPSTALRDDKQLKIYKYQLFPFFAYFLTYSRIQGKDYRIKAKRDVQGPKLIKDNNINFTSYVLSTTFSKIMLQTKNMQSHKKTKE